MLKNGRITMNADQAQYHTEVKPRGNAGFEMTRSALTQFMRNPARWLGGVGAGRETDSMRWGALVDMAYLTRDLYTEIPVVPDTFSHTVLKCPACGSVSSAARCRPCKCEREEVQVTEDWNPKSNTCKAWMDEHPGAITEAQDENIHRALKQLAADETIAAFRAASDTQVRVDAEWHDVETGLIVPVKCLIDLVPRAGSAFHRSLGDLKTTKMAHPTTWAREVFNRAYHIQAALYRDLYECASQESRPNWHFILSENYPPYATGRALLSTGFYELGKDAYESALKLYCWCIAEDRWPSADDINPNAVGGWSVAEPSPWMAPTIGAHHIEAMQPVAAPW